MTRTRRGDPLSLTEDLYAALRQGDLPSLLSLLAPGFSARLTPGLPWGLGERRIQGADAMVRDGWGVVAREMDLVAVPEESYVVDDVVVVQGEYRGHVRRTGRPIEAWFVHIWRVRGAKLVDLRQVTDTAAWRDAISSGDDIG